MYIHKNRIIIKQKLGAKNIAPLRHKIASIPKDEYEVKIDDTIKIESNNIESKENIMNIAYELKPWRKGPFQIFDNLINSEWNSYIKYNIIKNHLNINNKIVADIG